MDTTNLTKFQSEIGWLAGIIDGEGTLGIFQCKKVDENILYTARLVITNTDFILINECIRILTQLQVNPLIDAQTFKNSFWKPVRRVVLNRSKDIEKTLISISPHLISKKSLAETILQFIKLNSQRKKLKKKIHSLEELSLVSYGYQLRKRGDRRNGVVEEEFN